MHPYETYLWSEIMALLQSIEHVLNGLWQMLAACLPVILATLVGVVVVAVIGALAYLINTSIQPVRGGRDRAAGGVAVTEAGDLAMLPTLEEPWEIAADIWSMDQPSPEQASCH